MTTCPLSVPTEDDASPEASSPRANSSATTGPSRSPSPACTASMLGAGRPRVWKTDEASSSSDTLTAAARPIATGMSTDCARSSSRRSGRPTWCARCPVSRLCT